MALNFPIMAPPPRVDGCIVPGILSWRHLRRNVHPAGLFDRLQGLPGFDARAMSWDFEMETAVQNMEEDELEPWLEFHIARERQWFQIAAHLLQTENWSLAAVMFDGVDKLQHACWRHLDEPLPRHQVQSALAQRKSTYRLENCGAFRALWSPAFLRST